MKKTAAFFLLRLPQKNRAPSGVTLVEMLVVVVIVAILAGFLLPVLARMRSAADQSTCINNLKQLGIGMHSYAADHNGYLPAGSSPASQGSGTIEDYLEPYVAPWKDKKRNISADTFYCPTNVRLGSPPMEGYLINANGERYYKGWGGYFLGYRLNASIHPIKGEPSTDENATEEEKHPTYRIRLSSIRMPSKVISLLDTNTRLTNGAPPSAGYTKKSYFDPKSSDFAGFGLIHNGYANVLFVDGHVQSFNGSKPLPVASLPDQETTWWP